MRLALIFTFLSFLSFMLFFSSCRQEVDIDHTDTIYDLPVELINTHISGQVKDNKDKPIKDALINIHGEEALSDENGYFSFNDIKADKNGTHITVSKEGYFINIVTVYPILNHSLFSSIILNELSSTATILSWDGGNIDLGNGSWLDIEPNTLVYKDDGSNFEGEAYFELKLLQSGIDHFEELIPGELTGLTDKQERIGMDPIAVLQMSVQDKSGKKLRLAKGQKASIHIEGEYGKIPDGASNASMWSFDPQSSRWILNEKAEWLDENNFLGKINDLNNWCLAVPFDVVPINGVLQYENMADAGRHHIEIIEPGKSIKRLIKSDEQGSFTVFVPKDRELEISVLNECGVLVYQDALGLFADPTELALDLENVDDCKLLPVQGRLIDCEGNPVSEGYVKIKTEENINFYHTDENGYFYGEFRACSEGLMLDVSGSHNGVESFVSHHRQLYLNDGITVGDWVLCPQYEGSISLQFKDQFYFLHEGAGFELSAGSSLFYSNSPDIYFDCFIAFFQGEKEYFIHSETEADFLFSVNPNHDEAPVLFPDTTQFESFKLTIDQYIDSEWIEGRMQGQVRDTSKIDEQGMMYIKFSLPYVIK